MLDWHDWLWLFGPNQAYRNLVLIRISYSLKAESGKLKLWWRANLLDFFQYYRITGLWTMMIFSWAQLYVFWKQFFPFKLIRRVQFIRDMRTLMIHRPAKKQLKRIMLEIALGKKLSSKQFLNILNMDTIILTIGVTEGQ